MSRPWVRVPSPPPNRGFYRAQDEMVTPAAAGAPRLQEQLCEGLTEVGSPKRSWVWRSRAPLGVARAAMLFFGCLVGPRLGQHDDVPCYDEMWRLDPIQRRHVTAPAKVTHH